MAPSAGTFHSLLARNARLLKSLPAWKKWKQATRTLQEQLQSFQSTQLQPALARNSVRQPIPAAAALRQSKGRWYTTHSALNAAIRRFTTGTRQSAGVKYDRSSFPKSRVGAAVNGLSGRSPFAHGLRPNLTGGALPRSAGGYGLGGGARYFSHTPAAPAQVVHNVSQAVRAFLISGQKAQFDGFDAHGQKRYKAVSELQEEVSRKMNAVPKASPGSYIDFSINPTITALTPLDTLAGFTHPLATKQTLNTDGLLDVLSVDFSRALKDLSAVLNDLKRLSSLGDLPITYRGTTIRVHFPGCDASTVECLCDELGIGRGIVMEDSEFDAFVGTDIALLFPFAPSKSVSECSFFEKPVENRRLREPIEWRAMLTPEQASEMDFSTTSDAGLDFEDVGLENPWLSSPSGYESLHGSEASSYERPSKYDPLEYQGFEGIYRFMEACQSSTH